MYKTAEIKIAEIASDRDKRVAEIDLMAKVLANPVFEILAGYILVEYLQSHPERSPIIPSKAGTIAEGAIIASVVLQQLGPSLPILAAAGGDIAGHVATIAEKSLGSGTTAAAALALLPK